MASLYRVQTEIAGLAGGPGISTFHFLASAGSGQNAVDAVDDFWIGLQSAMSTSIVLTPTNEIVTFEDTTGEATSFTSYSGTQRAGTATGDRLPQATQGLVRWTTPSVVNGRRLQGRTFIPGPLEAASGPSGAPLTTYLSDLNAAAVDMLIAPTADLVIWHRPNADGAGTHSVVDGGTAWGEWAVLRGRRN